MAIGSCCCKSLTWFLLVVASGGMQRRISFNCVSALASSIPPRNNGGNHHLQRSSKLYNTRTASIWGKPISIIRGGQQPHVSSSTNKPRTTALQLAASASTSTNLSDMTPGEAQSLMTEIAKDSMGIVSSSLRMNSFAGIPYWDTSEFNEFRVLFVLGGPGAGKGTQSAFLEENYPTVHLSVGELLRKEQSKTDSPHRALIEECLVGGKIVPVEISLALLQQAMKEASKETSDALYLVDGFPRNFDNLEGWVRCMKGVASVWGVLVYKCPLEELERRILSRAETSGRSDDNIKSAEKRFRTFERETMPVVHVLQIVQEMQEQQDSSTPALQVEEIEGNQSIEDVWRDTQSVMNGFVANDVWTANAKLLRAVQQGDAEAYAKLCSPDGDMSPAQLLETHEGNNSLIDVSNPKMEFVSGSKVIVSYDRTMGNDASSAELVRETRVWSHQGNRGWINVHFSRTPAL